jgi:hypothetical protein
MKMPNYIYFIRPAGANGPIKIGCSSVPKDRLEAISVWSPLPLEMIGTVPGSFDDEKFLHQCFADQHSHREWFHASDKLETIIAEILDAGSIAPARTKLSPVRSIRSGSNRPRTESERQHHSRSLRLAWIHRQRYRKGVSMADPPEVSSIMSRWRGWAYRHIAGVTPTPEQIAIVDAYLLSSKAELALLPDRNAA